jgi:hypothetical protein
VLRAVRGFVGEHWGKLLLVSVLILLPCFWHRHIEAGDLGSHAYNAWLAQLIERGQAPGLLIAHPWTNVLFDYLLSGLARAFGLHVAEEISVSLSVLVFFWGAFAFVAAASRGAPWFLIPAIAMIAYGWTFEMGFMNYYISLGLAFFALALFWRGEGWKRALSLAFVPFIYLAHPLGLIWLISAAAYIWIAERVPLWLQWLLLLTSAAGLYGLRLFLWRHFIVDTVDGPPYIFNGGDQFLLFGDRYKIVEAAFGVFVVVALVIDLIHRRKSPGFWRAYLIPLQLFILVEAGVFLLPDGVRASNDRAALALVTERLTTVSAVLVCCLLAAMLPRKSHLIALAGIAGVFFSFLYRDTAIVDRMEMQVERRVGTLPPGVHVLATIRKPEESRVGVQHTVDRACIGHCFSYGNYEPPSKDFRIRALPGNPFVMTNSDDTAAMEEGDYIVKSEDLPAYQIYQCSEDWTELCIRPLAEGEDNDRLGVRPE